MIKMDDFTSEIPLPDLFCQEDDDFCLNDEEIIQKEEIFELSEADCEFFDASMQKETRFQPGVSQSERSSPTRLNTIKWIVDTTLFFGFEMCTAYLAMIYFDRFCGRRSIDDLKTWTVKLLSIACLSLAGKMEESKIPALSDFHVDEYNFEGKVVQRMELLVMKTLGWNLSDMTPFGYLEFFATKFLDEYRLSDPLTRARELIMVLLKEVNAAETRPSVVAAAAMLAAYDHQLTKDALETKMNDIKSWGSCEKELVFSCYNLLQEVIASRSKTPKSVLSLESFSASSSSSGLTDDSTVRSISGVKRRLTYTNHDQHCPPRKSSRQ